MTTSLFVLFVLFNRLLGLRSVLCSMIMDYHVNFHYPHRFRFTCRSAAITQKVLGSQLVWSPGRICTSSLRLHCSFFSFPRRRTGI